MEKWGHRDILVGPPLGGLRYRVCRAARGARGACIVCVDCGVYTLRDGASNVARKRAPPLSLSMSHVSDTVCVRVCSVCRSVYGVLGYLLCVFSVLSFSTVRKQCPCAHTTRARPLTDPRARWIRWRPYPCGPLATVGGPTSPDPRAVIDPRQRPRVASRPRVHPKHP